MSALLPLLLLQSTPAWAPQTSQSPATGASSFSVGIISREHNARLAVRCDVGADPVVSVQYISNAALGATEDRPVSVTVDNKPAIEATWEFPGTGTFTRDSALVTQLTVAMATAKTIHVHTADLNNAPVDATFDGPTSSLPIRQVLEACNYQFGVVPAPVKLKPAPDAGQ